MRYSTKSIRYKLLAMMLSISSLCIFVGYTLFVSWYIHDEHQDKIELTNNLTNVLSQDFANLIFLNDDIKEANDITNILHSYKNIEKIALYNKKLDTVFVYTKNKKRFTPQQLSKNPQEYTKTTTNKLLLLRKIYYQNMQFGFMYAELRTEPLLHIILDDLPSLLGFLLLIMLSSFLVSLYYSKSFTEPILKLVNFLKSVDLQQEKEQRVEDKSDIEEFQILFEKTNTFLKKNREANRELKIASVAFEIDSAMVVTDAEYRVLEINSAYSAITGFYPEDVLGKILPLFQHKEEDTNLYEEIEEQLHKENYWSGDILNYRKNGASFIEHLSIYGVVNDAKSVVNYLFSFLDVTKQREIEKRLHYLQEYDSLTGLDNKSLAMRKIDKNLSERGVFISLDIRRFSEINGLYGYEIGDMLLKEVTSCIQKVFPTAITISRIENNRFIIYTLCTKTTKEEITLESKADAEYLITLLHEKAFTLQEHTISITLNIGIVLSDQKENAKELFEKGNKILEEAKEQEQNILFFNQEVTNKTVALSNLYTQLQHAIKNGELELYYQLQYDAQQKPYATESLIRWNHPTEGLVFPDAFIPLAEKTGLISELGRLVIKLGCEQLVAWQKNPHTKDLLLSINLGAKHFQEDDLVEQVKNIIEDYNFPHHNLKIELTEYTMVRDIDTIAKKMYALKDMGMQISLDDFGTGFSALQYLQYLPIDQLKIDQTFVMHMFQNRTNIVIIESIINLTNALGIEVIAEGVETKELYEKLLELGCRHYQGYYFAKPQKIAVVDAKLEEFFTSGHKK